MFRDNLGNENFLQTITDEARKAIEEYQEVENNTTNEWKDD